MPNILSAWQRGRTVTHHMPPVENGMNFIDVSPYYGHYKAETVLGKALKEIPRDKYYLSTSAGNVSLTT
jgi:aryl-alcohol dehydrogenase-like predicted oxidoreductase